MIKVHGEAGGQIGDNIRRNGEELTTLGSSLPEPKQRRAVSGITTGSGIRIKLLNKPTKFSVLSYGSSHWYNRLKNQRGKREN